LYLFIVWKGGPCECGMYRSSDHAIGTGTTIVPTLVIIIESVVYFPLSIITRIILTTIYLGFNDFLEMLMKFFRFYKAPNYGI